MIRRQHDIVKQTLDSSSPAWLKFYFVCSSVVGLTLTSIITSLKSQFCDLQNGGKIRLFVNRIILAKISGTWLLSKYWYPPHPTSTLHFPPDLLLPNNSLTRAPSYAPIQGAWRKMKKAKHGGSWHLRSRVKFTDSEPWNQPITTLRKVSAEIKISGRWRREVSSCLGCTDNISSVSCIPHPKFIYIIALI